MEKFTIINCRPTNPNSTESQCDLELEHGDGSTTILKMQDRELMTLVTNATDYPNVYFEVGKLLLEAYKLPIIPANQYGVNRAINEVLDKRGIKR